MNHHSPTGELFRLLAQASELLEQIVNPIPGNHIATFYVRGRYNEIGIRLALADVSPTVASTEPYRALTRWRTLLNRLLDPPANDTSEACYAEAVTCRYDIWQALLEARGES